MLLLTGAIALAGANQIQASGGSYVFDGGSALEQSQVRQALSISSFPWSLVPTTILIHIRRGLPSSTATPGEIWLDADLLDAGDFSWGVVQHEYAHQVDFLVLTDEARQELYQRLGGASWCDQSKQLPHGDYGCERFASTLAWAYWQSSRNSMKPESSSDESASMKPAAFRDLLGGILGRRDLLATGAHSARHAQGVERRSPA